LVLLGDAPQSSTSLPYTTLFRSPRFKDVDPLQLVEDLVDKSLLIAQRDAAERHYRMLSTTRIYAMRKLEEEGGVERIIARHAARSEEHTSELQSRENIVCRLLLE